MVRGKDGKGRGHHEDVKTFTQTKHGFRRIGPKADLYDDVLKKPSGVDTPANELSGGWERSTSGGFGDALCRLPTSSLGL